MAKLSMLGAASQQIIATKTSKITTVLASRDFVDGFNEVRQGKPFDYSRKCKDDIWRYERGRQLALVYRGPLKEGRRLVDAAISAYIDARSAGVIL